MTRKPQVYVYRWGKYRPEWKGRKCVALARGAMNTALVRFLDTGEAQIIIRNALAKVKE